MGKAKLTVTIDEILIKTLDEWSKKRGESRSRLVEKAVRSWQRRQIEQELIEGYRAMAGEDKAAAESRLSAGFEVME
jgi:metal-responsive CopG/Arc/MetJ family transcriptional regulator